MANSKIDLPRLARDYAKDLIQSLSPTGHHEQVNGVSASSTSTETFYIGQLIRIAALDNPAYFNFGTDAVTSADKYLPADTVEYFRIKSDTKITVYGAIVDITVML